MALCGEDKAALPIKVEDAREGLDLEFLQIVPGSKDREGRLVSVDSLVRLALVSDTRVHLEGCLFGDCIGSNDRKRRTWT